MLGNCHIKTFELMGRIAIVQQMVTSTLQKEGKSRKVIAQEASCL